QQRAGTLQNNVKIKAFEEVSERISSHLGFLQLIAKESEKSGKKLDQTYFNGLVNAALLPVYPTDAQHLNGTFQFCNSLGRKLKVINQSIADGCFRTLKELVEGASTDSFKGRTDQTLIAKRRMPALVVSNTPSRRKDQNGPGHYCPFFEKVGDGKAASFSCPFSEHQSSKSIFDSCITDKEHRRQHKELVRPGIQPAVAQNSPGILERSASQGDEL